MSCMNKKPWFGFWSVFFFYLQVMWETESAVALYKTTYILPKSLNLPSSYCICSLKLYEPLRGSFDGSINLRSNTFHQSSIITKMWGSLTVGDKEEKVRRLLFIKGTCGGWTYQGCGSEEKDKNSDSSIVEINGRLRSRSTYGMEQLLSGFVLVSNRLLLPPSKEHRYYSKAAQK